MENLSAERKADGIHVEATLDGEVRKHLFGLDTSAEEIKAELLATEANIKDEKKSKAKQEQEDKDNTAADNTINALLSNPN